MSASDCIRQDLEFKVDTELPEVTARNARARMWRVRALPQGHREVSSGLELVFSVKAQVSE